MNIFLLIIRVLVGLLFIFSGLIKANDPLGLSYKMQEFFELWDMARFNSYSLNLSIAIISFEIIAGVALILGWRMKIFSWLLLLLILFFTFLTGYAYLSGKFKNCGCFGDCIPITPFASYLKDLVLLGFITLLVIFRRRIKPIFPEKINLMLMLLTAIISLWLQFYVLKHLPIIDCLPFKEKNNIVEKMKIPPGARPDSFALRFIYEKEGKLYEFDASALPADLETYTYKDRIDKLVRKGNAEAPIKGFTLSGVTDIDSTDLVLSQPAYMLLMTENFSVPLSKWAEEFSGIYAYALKNGIPVALVTTSIANARQHIKGTSFEQIQVFKCDFTAIRTAARANPTLYLLEKGKVSGKWGWVDFEEASEEIGRTLAPRTEGKGG